MSPHTFERLEGRLALHGGAHVGDWPGETSAGDDIEIRVGGAESINRWRVDAEVAGTTSGGSPCSRTVAVDVSGLWSIGSNHSFSMTQGGAITTTVNGTLVDDIWASGTVNFRASGQCNFNVDRPFSLNGPDGSPSISLDAARASAVEGSGAVRIRASAQFPWVRSREIAVTAGGTAVQGQDYTLSSSAIEIPANQTSGRIDLAVIDDAADEPNEEVILTFANPGNGETVTPRSIGITIIDNDEPLPLPGVILNPTNISLAEGGISQQYTLVLNAPPSADVTIGVATDGQASASPAEVMFTPGNWNEPRTVVMTAVDDNIAEGPHVSTVTHTAMSADGRYHGIMIDNVSATIADNDTAGVQVSPAMIDVAEGGQGVSYEIVLTSQPTSAVVVTAHFDSQLVGGGTMELTFTRGDWSQPQSVPVTATDDSDVEGEHAAAITHSVASADSMYDGIPVPDVSVTIVDNDFLPMPGDTDNDGDVDVDDLNNVRNQFGATGADDGSLVGDAFPFDGVVDIDDLNAVRNNFGGTVDRAFAHGHLHDLPVDIARRKTSWLGQRNVGHSVEIEYDRLRHFSDNLHRIRHLNAVDVVAWRTAVDGVVEDEQFLWRVSGRWN